MSRAQKTMLAVAIIAVILISAWLFVAVPELEKMPADYHSQVEFDGELRWLEPGVEELGAPFPFKDAMTHQVLTRSGDVLIIQSNVIAKDPATGKIFWEAKERMGVDRATRQHVAGFGDMDRQGYFTFPLHVQKRDYEFWYPGILAKGPCVFETGLWRK